MLKILIANEDSCLTQWKSLLEIKTFDALFPLFKIGITAQLLSRFLQK